MKRLRALLLLLAATAATSAGATLTYPGTGGLLPDSDGTLPGVFPSTITVTDAGTILAAGNNVEVRLLGLQHSWAGDLVVFLTFQGISADIFYRIGIVNAGDPGFGSNFGDIAANYVFSATGGDLWAAANIPDSESIPGANYFPVTAGGAPSNLPAAFNGQPIAGVWTLTIQDESQGDEGSIVGWELVLTTEDPVSIPEPGYGALTGVVLALLAATRTRSRPSHPNP
jgi:hypothetical protein